MSGGVSKLPSPRPVHPLVIGLAELLPREGGSWTRGEAKRWLAAAGAIFDLIYEMSDRFDSEGKRDA